ncbi:AAA family ATPase [Chryseobacterium vaccae]|uniref:AAA family ATPase n=1 Tax=Chryseobacterium vaccae TaxID=2604424 RepID=UPI0012950173|nr:AAA family ATPase [Chryseobacterium vaccae]
MIENYITNIFVKESINIRDFNIPLSENKRQHLILTGKNGSGKTSLLLEIKKYITLIDDGQFMRLINDKDHYKHLKEQLADPNFNDSTLLTHRAVNNYEILQKLAGGTEINFSGTTKDLITKSESGNFILAFFDSKRHTRLNIPTGINKVELNKKYSITEQVNLNFIQFIVNLKADRSFARDDNELDTVEKIDKWFNDLENRLKLIFDAENLELRFDRKTYNFDIIINNLEPFNFNTLSDGYSSIISIVTELLLRMEAHQAKFYDLEGIVIIDEIETHLHVDLQKKIFPFLTDFFPKIQFIVTTHSPFVLSSISNATICDLETRIITTDLSSYSYDTLIESYFGIDKYSEEVKQKVLDFENLILKEELSFSEEHHLKELKSYFDHSPKYLSNELRVKLQEIELNAILKNKKRKSE